MAAVVVADFEERAVAGLVLAGAFVAGLVAGAFVAGLALLVVAFVATALTAGLLAAAPGSDLFTTPAFLPTADTEETLGRFMAGSIAFCVWREGKNSL